MNENEKAQRESEQRRPSAMTHTQWGNLLASAPSLKQMLDTKEKAR